MAEFDTTAAELVIISFWFFEDSARTVGCLVGLALLSTMCQVGLVASARGSSEFYSVE